MDNVFAAPGDSFQQIGGECPSGWVTMEGRRPTLEHVANEVGEWVLPPPVVPAAVTKYQCCVILARHGFLAQTNEFFADMAADDPRRLAWEMASTVQRRSDSTLAAIEHLEISLAQADAMFIEAGQVV